MKLSEFGIVVAVTLLVVCLGSVIVGLFLLVPWGDMPLGGRMVVGGLMGLLLIALIGGACAS